MGSKSRQQATVQDVVRTLEEWAPREWAYDWDPVGLQIGDPNAAVARVLVCLTVTPEAAEAAASAQAQMIVAHHPLIFKPLKTLRFDDPIARLCLDLAHQRIACYGAHTNLDVAPGGVSHILAAKLGLQDTEPLFRAPHIKRYKLVAFVPDDHLAAVRGAVSAAGAGIIGNYTHCTYSNPGTGTFVAGEGADPYVGKKQELHEEPERRMETLVPSGRVKAVLRALAEAHPYEEPAYDLVPLEGPSPEAGLGVRGRLEQPMAPDAFARCVCRRLALEHVQLVQGVREIKRVAVLGGSGGGEISRIPHDIDAYVTGDVKYHDADLARTRGITVIDAGHAGTELPAVGAVAEYLREKLPQIDVQTYQEPAVFKTVAAGNAQ